MTSETPGPSPEDMGIDSSPNQPERSVEVDPDERLLRRLGKFMDSYPYPDFTDEDGQREWKRQTRRGQVENLLDDSETSPVHVMTGSGAVVPHERELVTNRMEGCITILMVGPEGKSMVHMTPTTKLAYEAPYLDDSVRQIMESTAVLGDPSERSLVVMANDMETPKYRAESYEEWGAIQKAFEGAGVGAVRIHELPMSETMLFHSPDAPKFVYAYGWQDLRNDDGTIYGYDRRSAPNTDRIPVEGESSIPSRELA